MLIQLWIRGAAPLTCGHADGYTATCDRKQSPQAPVAEWYTRQVEGLGPKGRGGSSPLGGTSRECGDRDDWCRGRSCCLHKLCGGLICLTGRGPVPSNGHGGSSPLGGTS